MVNVVKTALNNEDYELLEQCPGTTVSEKLRYCVQKAANGASTMVKSNGKEQREEEALESVAENEDRKTSEIENELLEKKNELVEENNGLNLVLDETEEERDSFRAECLAKDREIARLKTTTCSTEILPEVIKEAISAKIAFDKSKGFIKYDFSEFARNLKEQGYSWSELHDAVKSYVVSDLKKNIDDEDQLKEFSEGIGVTVQDLQRST